MPVTIHTLSVIAAPEPQSPRIIRILHEIAEQVRNDKAFYVLRNRV